MLGITEAPDVAIGRAWRLTSAGGGGFDHPCRDVDCDAVDARASVFDLASVQPGANLKSERLERVDVDAFLSAPD